MNILSALHALLGQHQQQAPKQPVDPNFAQHVAQNQPVDPRYAALHPQALHQLLQVRPNAFRGNLGVPTGNQVQMGQLRQRPQLGDFMPGYTPLQNSGFGPQGNPQFGAYNPNQNPGFSPQDNPNQQYWN